MSKFKKSKNDRANKKALEGARFRRMLVPGVPEILESRRLLATLTVTNTNDSGAGSLRQAILDVNSSTDASNTIQFSILSGTGPGHKTINVGSTTDLPAIVKQVLIDGRTQPGYSTLTGVPLIEISGSGSASMGLTIGAAPSAVIGLVVNGFSQAGIWITGGGTAVQDCYIGTNFTGTAAHPNLNGIQIFSSNNLIGTNGDGLNDALEGNLISGNTGDGVIINGNSNLVQGNLIGTNAAGSAAIANSKGVNVSGNSNIIGTNGDGVNDTAERNVISGNTVGVGVYSGTNNKVAGNYIGTNASGTSAVSNSDGIAVFTSAGSVNYIGTDGSNDAFNSHERNIVSGNSGLGIRISGPTVVAGNLVGLDVSGNVLANPTGIEVDSGGGLIGSNGDGIADDAERNVIGGSSYGIYIVSFNSQTGVTIAGNYVGTDPSGTQTRANTYGVYTNNGESNTIGGSSAATRNLISGNTYGVYLATKNNWVEGNYIGTDVNGTQALANQYGVWVGVGPGNIIGTNSDGVNDGNEGNVISGNSHFGVLINSNGNTVAGNLIGTDKDGSSVVGTSQSLQPTGVYLFSSSSNTIGGSASAARNVISGNMYEGIRISGGSSNLIKGNLLGLKSSKNAALGNEEGILIDQSDHNTISDCTIAGNTYAGISILYPLSTANLMVRNNIGALYGSGGVLLGNSYGIRILNGANANKIGDGLAGDANTISGSSLAGIQMNGAGTSGNIVAGNYIGTDTSGSGSFPNNTGVAIEAGASGNFIGTNGDGVNDSNEGNLISGNIGSGTGYGIEISGSSGNHVSGNKIGTTLDGTGSNPNVTGIVIDNGAKNNIVGTNADGVSDTLERNLISGNSGIAIYVKDSGTNNNKIQGNYIGTDLTGMLALGNTVGIQIVNGPTGTLIGTNADGVRDSVEANVISGSTAAPGIFLSGSDNNLIAGNFIGTNYLGTAAIGNAYAGIELSGSSHNTIGGSIPAARNIISGNVTNGGGVVLGSGSTFNLIQGNYIGTNAAGNAALGNVNGIDIYDSSSNTLDNNLISGSIGGNGVIITCSNTLLGTLNVLTGNKIGTDATGTVSIPNSYGVRVESYNNTIGKGRNNSQGNLISGNTNAGIDIRNASYTRISGNLIGTDVSGAFAIANDIGVLVENPGAVLVGYNLIGTDGDGVNDANEGNLISGNTRANGYGIEISGGFNTHIAGNIIGLNLDGTSAIPNSYGIWQTNSTQYTQIGTNADGLSDNEEKNVISGNTVVGVFLGTNSSDTNLWGNYIGTGSDGTTSIGNSVGVQVEDSNSLFHPNVIGTDTGTTGYSLTSYETHRRNVISGNAAADIDVISSSSVNIAGNYIGLDATGLHLANGTNSLYGILIEGGSSDILVGGKLATSQNIISGHSTAAIVVNGGQSNIITNNYIGTDLYGIHGLGNGIGIELANGAVNTVIGGFGFGNVIASGTVAGILIGEDFNGLVSTVGTTIVGNLVGTNPYFDPSAFGVIGSVVQAGTLDLGNQIGIRLAKASNTRIGGPTNQERNVISNNPVGGILFESSSAFSNLIEGNYIGTNATGTAAGPGIQGYGIQDDGTDSLQIGGDSVAARNVISHNGTGITLGFSTNCSIQGNLIGTDVNGTHAIPNGTGIYLSETGTGILIGGASSVLRNIISGNDFQGIYDLDTTHGDQIQGNYIGTDINGTNALPNGEGIVVSNSTGVAIGSVINGSGNLISGNTLEGLNIAGSTGTTVIGNKIGTDKTGLVSLPNGTDGVQFSAGSHHNTVGTTEYGQSNKLLAGTNYSRYKKTNGLEYGLNSFGVFDAFGNSIASGGYIFTPVDFSVDPDPFSGALQLWVLDSTSGLIRVDVSTGNQTLISDFSDGTQGNSPSRATSISGLTPYGYYVTDTDGNAIYRIDTQSGQRSLVASGGLLQNPVGVVGNVNGGGLMVADDLAGLIYINFSGSQAYIPLTYSRLTSITSDFDAAYVTDSPLFGIPASVYRYDFGSQTVRVVSTGVAGNTEGSLATDINGNVTFLVSIPGGQQLTTLTPESVRNIISGNTGHGVLITDSSTYSNTVQASYIGVDLSGELALGNGSDGVKIVGGAITNLIGGTSPGTGNVISANGGNGVFITDPSFNAANLIQGNLIGTDALGYQALGNYLNGVTINDTTTGNIVGGSVPGARNVISGQTHDVGGGIAGWGVTLASDKNVVEGNYIGTDISGSIPLGNVGGILVYSGDANTIGYPTSDGSNVISGNLEIGIAVYHATNTRIVNNRIGGSVDGPYGLALSNGTPGVTVSEGILLTYDSTGTIIGGPTASYNNKISYNGIGIDVESSNNTISGNWIGINTGYDTNPTPSTGILIGSGNNNIIGGPTASVGSGAGNVIGGNVNQIVIHSGVSGTTIQGNLIGAYPTVLLPPGVFDLAGVNQVDGIDDGGINSRILGNLIGGGGGSGIVVTGGSSTIQGNLIGVDIYGRPFVNRGDGITLDLGTSNDLIGGTATGAGNTIAFNWGSGIRETPSAGTNNSAEQNRIIGNRGLGIDIGPLGPTPNDPGDLNGLPNAPVITRASIRAHVLDISGFARAGTTIEFYVAGVDPSGFGQGTEYLGRFVEGTSDDRDTGFGSYASPLRGLNVGFDTTNSFHFVFSVPDDVSEGSIITAVSAVGMSEFSGNIKADAGTVFGAPVVDAGPRATLAEGATFSSQGTFTDLDSTSWTAMVDYGDGSGFQPLVINPVTLGTAGDQYAPTATGTFGLQHKYVLAGDYVVTVQVTDDSHATGTGFTKIHIVNSPPTVDNTDIQLTPTVLNQHQAVTLTGKFADATPIDTHSVQVIWGDGSIGNATVDESAKTFTAVHTYEYGGPAQASTAVYSVQIIVTDASLGQGKTTSGLFQVQVNNVLPSNLQLSLAQADPFENGFTHLTGTFSDPGTLDTHKVVVDWGDGTTPSTLQLNAGVLQFDANHKYLNNPVAPAGSFKIHVEVTDQHEPLRPTTQDIDDIVQDVPASNLVLITNPVNGSILEGGKLTLSGSFIDPGMLDHHVVTVDWGDGSPLKTVSLGAGILVFSGFSHTYLDNPVHGVAHGTYPVTVTVTDPAETNGPSLAKMVPITVANVAPTVGTLSLTKPDGTPLFLTNLNGAVGQIDEGGSVLLTGKFSDAGVLDNHVVMINWGDGTAPTEANVDERHHSFTATHLYLDNTPVSLISLDTIKVSVADGDTGVGTGSIGLGVANVAPTIKVLSGGFDSAGNPILIASGSDDGPIDAASLTYTWTVTGPNNYSQIGIGATFTLIPLSLGTSYTVTMTVTDNDQISTSSKVLVWVLDNSNNRFSIPDPGPSYSSVVVFGGKGDDVIAAGQLQFDSSNNLIRDADGVPVVANPLNIPVVLDGGPGTDTLVGGNGDDVIYLYNGNDSGYGRAGNDLYVMTPNSTLTVVDASGNNTLDFGRANFGVTFDLSQIEGQIQNVQPGVPPPLNDPHLVSVNGLGTGRFGTLLGSKYSDFLTAASNSKISGGGGNDHYLVNSSATKSVGNVTINGGADADTLTLMGIDVGAIIFNGDDGANTLVNEGFVVASLVFNGGADADVLVNQAGATIGNDLTFNGDDGANQLLNYGVINTNATPLIFNGGADADTLINEIGGVIDSALVFNGDAGFNSVYNYGVIDSKSGPLVYNGGADADTLINEAGAVIMSALTFNGDDGANLLQNLGTIDAVGQSLVFNGGADADTLINSGLIESILIFNGDDGANELKNFGTIDAGTSTLVFNGGADADTLVNEVGGLINSPITFNGDDGANTLLNLGTLGETSLLVFQGGADADTLINALGGTIDGALTFNGDDGADLLQNFGSIGLAGVVTMNGGADGATLVNEPSGVVFGTLTFNGDAGADILINAGVVAEGATLTMTGGADANTLLNSGIVEGTLIFNGDKGSNTLVNGAYFAGKPYQTGTIANLIFHGGADGGTLINPGTIDELTFNGDDAVNELLNGAVVNGSVIAGTITDLIFNGGADTDILLNPGTVTGSIIFNGDGGSNTLINGYTFNSIVYPGHAGSISFRGGADADTLINPGTVDTTITFNGDDGVNELLNQGPVLSILFNGGADSDLLLNQADRVESITFNGDRGANLLVNDGSYVSSILFNGGSDVDVLANNGANVELITFNGDGGADTLINSGATTSGYNTTIIFNGDDHGKHGDTLINKGSGTPQSLDSESDSPSGRLSILFHGDDGANILVNTGDYVTSLVFVGGADTDTLLNTGIDVGTITFQGDDGANVLRNDGSVLGLVTFDGGADADTLLNTGTLGDLTFNGDGGGDVLANTHIINGNVLFAGGAQPNTLVNLANATFKGHVTFNGGSDADTLINAGLLSDLTFNGDDGVNTLINQLGGTLTDTTFLGGADSDKLVNFGTMRNVTFQAGGGTNGLENAPSGVMSGIIYNAGSDSDTLLIQPGATASDITFNGDGGKDLIYNQADAVSSIVVNSGAGNTRFWNSGNFVSNLQFLSSSSNALTVNTFVNSGSNVSSLFFATGNGTNTLFNSGQVDSINYNAGTGSDTFANTASYIRSISFQGESGSKTLTNSGDWIQTIIIQTGPGTASFTNSGSNLRYISFAGRGSDTLNNSGNQILSIYFTGNGTDTLNNTGDFVTSIFFLAAPDGGADTLIDSGYAGPNSTLKFDGGNLENILIFLASAYVTNLDFHGGAGNDQALIFGSADSMTLAGDAGDDTYQFEGTPTGNVTIVEAYTGSSDTSSDTLDFSGYSAGPLNLRLDTTATQNISTNSRNGYGLSLTFSDSMGIENVIGTPFADTIYGNDRNNTITTDAVNAQAVHPGSPIAALPTTQNCQWVLLDFDTYTKLNRESSPSQHIYTPAERDAIQARIEYNYHGPDPTHPWFNVHFTQSSSVIPAGIQFATLYFNRTPSFNRPGGEASEVDLGNTNPGGYASIQVNGLMGGADQPELTTDNLVRLSAKIGAHELAHLMGVRHSDAFGPIGFGVHTPPGSSKFNPDPGLPGGAYETFDHLISSPATDGSSRFNDLGDLSFGAREAIKLSIADHGVTTSEQSLSHGTLQGAQPLALDPLYVPNTSTTGVDQGKILNVNATLIAGYIGIDPNTGRAESDMYSFQGKRGDIFCFEIDSVLLARLAGRDTIDSVISIYDSNGNLVPYYGGTAVNDDQFEPTDSLLQDVILPADGTYYIEVKSFSRSPNDPIFDPTNPASPLYAGNLNSLLNPLNPNFSQTLLDNFMATKSGTDTGGYNLLVYKYQAISLNTHDVGNKLYGLGGDDTLIGTTGTDLLIGGAGRDTINAGAGGPNYRLVVTPSVSKTTLPLVQTFQAGVNFSDPSGSTTWHVSIDFQDGQTEEFDTDSLDPISLSHDFTASGTYNTTITVTNDDGIVGSTSISVIVVNQATPTVTAVAPDAGYNSQIYASESATVTGLGGITLTTPAVTFTYYTSVDYLLKNPLPGAPSDAGSYQLVAHYAGNLYYTSADSLAIPFKITPAGLTVSITPVSMTYGSTVPVLSGTVSGLFGSDSVNLRYSTTATSASDVGSYPITVTLASQNYVLKPGGVSSLTFNDKLTIKQAAPSISLTAPDARYSGSAYSQASASVTGIGGVLLSAPSLVYYNGNDISLSSPLADAPTNAGSYIVVANYAGSLDYAAGSSRTGFSITPRNTLATLVANTPGTLVPGQTASFTVTVTGGLTAPFIPGGTVQLQVDGQNVGQPVTLGADGTATLTSNSLASGSRLITVAYSGNANFAASTSSSVTQSIYYPGVYVVGTVLYVIGSNTADTIQINAAGGKIDGSTGLQVSATLKNVYSSKSYVQTFTAIMIYGYDGNDNVQFGTTLALPATILEGNGNDYIKVGNGNDSITLGTGSNQVYGGNGNKTVISRDLPGTTGYFSLGSGNNSLNLGDGADQVILGNGNDILTLGNGNNTITVGNGNDLITVGNGDNVITEGNGADTITAGNGSNLIIAGLGRHTVTVGTGTNILIDGSATVANTGDSLRSILSDWKAGNAAGNTVNIRLKVTYQTAYANYFSAGGGRNWFFYKSPSSSNKKSTDKWN